MPSLWLPDRDPTAQGFQLSNLGSGRVAARLVATAIEFASGGQNVGMVGKPVEERDREFLITENADPFTEGQVCRHHCRAPLIAFGEDVEKQLSSGAIERNKPQLVEHQELIFQ